MDDTFPSLTVDPALSRIWVLKNLLSLLRLFQKIWFVMPLVEVDMDEFLVPQSRRQMRESAVSFAPQTTADPMPIYDLNRPISCGTTTICMEFEGGVVLGEFQLNLVLMFFCYCGH